MTTYRGEDMIGDDGYGTTEHALKSAHAALWAIANMQVQEETDKGEVLALCMSIARLELEKCSQEALENIEKAAISWIEAAKELGQEIPLPSIERTLSASGKFPGWQSQLVEEGKVARERITSARAALVEEE